MMYKRWVKRSLLALGVIGAFFLTISTNSAVARADNSTIAYNCAVWLQPEDDAQGAQSFSLSYHTDTPIDGDITYSTLQDSGGASGYDMILFMEILFNNQNGILTDDQAISEGSKLNGIDVDATSLPDFINGSNVSDYKGYSIDLKEAFRRAQESSPVELIKPQTYNVTKPFMIPLKANDLTTTIHYVYADGKTANPDKVIQGASGTGKKPIAITSPTIPGYVPDKSSVTVSFDQAGNSDTMVTYRKPSPTPAPTTSQATLTAKSSATLKPGQTINAALFDAQATDAQGKTIPVSVDLSKVNTKVAGTYPVTLTAANGKTFTTSLTIPASAIITSTQHDLAGKQEVIYGLKTFYLYRQPTFTAKQRLATYHQVKRTQRPMFVVTGYAHSNAGRLRYAVKDVNHGSATYGKTGYVTTKQDFVVPVYYQQAPQRVKVIANHGINAYRHNNLTAKAQHIAKGTTLKIKGIIRYHKTTRFLLTNGHYITANKKLVIANS